MYVEYIVYKETTIITLREFLIFAFYYSHSFTIHSIAFIIFEASSINYIIKLNTNEANLKKICLKLVVPSSL